MHLKTYGSAAIAGLIAMGTATLAVLGNVSTFAEVSEVTWAILAIGGAMQFLKDVQSSNRTPENGARGDA